MTQTTEANPLEVIINNLSLEELMNFDSFHEAEKIAKFTNTPNADSLALNLQMLSVAARREKLKNSNDTNNSTTFKEFQDLLAIEGFTEVYTREFKEEETSHFRDEKEELVALTYERSSLLYVYWNYDLNILINGTTYPSYSMIDGKAVKTGETINSVDMKYTIKMKDGVDYSDARMILSSCGNHERSGTIVGSHDIRQGFRRALKSLKEYYTFTKWEGKQSLWLLHYFQYSNNKEYSVDEINQDVLSKLPQKVLDGMNNKWYGAPMSLEEAKDSIINSYFHYEVLENMSFTERDIWFNSTINPGLNPMWVEEELLPNAWRKNDFMKKFTTYVKISGGTLIIT